MRDLPSVGEWRRFAWDDYRSRWFVVDITTPYGGRTVVVLRRENSPFYADQAEVTVDMWNTGVQP